MRCIGIGDRIVRPDAKKLEQEGRFDTLPEYTKLAKKLIGKYMKGKTRDEDLVAEIAYQLMVADWKWDSTKSTKYYNRKKYVLWAINDYYRDSKIIGQKVEKMIAYSEATGYEEHKGYNHQIKRAEHDEHIKARVDTIRHVLSEQESKFVDLYFFDNNNSTETAKKMGLSPGRVAIIKKQTINKLKGVIDEQFFKV